MSHSPSESGQGDNPERENPRQPISWDAGAGMHRRRGGSRPNRGSPSPGRRRSDHDPRATISRKLVVVTVVLANALYLAGEVLIFGEAVCR